MNKWDEEKQKFQDLLNWMIEKEGGLVSKLNIEFISTDNRYIIACRDIKPEEILISIPNKIIFNIFHPEVAPFMNHIKKKMDNEMIALSVFFMCEIQKEQSKYKLFLDYLPKSLNDHPLFYLEDKRKYLKGTYLLDKLKIWENQLQEEFDNLCELNVGLIFEIKEFTLEKYKNSRSLVWSRNFNAYYHGIGYSSLIPVADMCNTDPHKINTDWFYDEKSEKFIIKAIKEIKKDEEVILRYGYEDNIHFLFFYGFTIQNNPTKIGLYIYDTDLKGDEDNEIVLKNPLDIHEGLKKFRKSKVGVVKNLKMELNYLKALKKSLQQRLNGYYNQNNIGLDKNIYEEAFQKKDFDIINIFRVILDEKEFLNEHIIQIEKFEGIFNEICQVKYVKNQNIEDIKQKIKEIKEMNYSEIYTKIILNYLEDH